VLPSWPPAPSHPVIATRRAVHLLAPNASEWTYEGTNTWVLGLPGRSGCLVVDPGTDDEAHLGAVLATARSQGWSVGGILVTHNHGDHATGADRLRDLTGAPVYAHDERIADRRLTEGDDVRVEGVAVRVLHTPGHSDDSLTFWLPDEGSLLTGDTILGRRSSAVFGRLADFLDSATRIRDLAGDGVALLPGHGRPLRDPVDVIDRAIAVRRQRVDQVARLLDAGVSGIPALTDAIYPGLPPQRRRAAQSSVRAALDHLTSEPAH
jgi:glyoxylase-like metal-dependent hydrolase (beta-lactamase superfamily II)